MCHPFIMESFNPRESVTSSILNPNANWYLVPGTWLVPDTGYVRNRADLQSPADDDRCAHDGAREVLEEVLRVRPLRRLGTQGSARRRHHPRRGREPRGYRARH